MFRPWWSFGFLAVFLVSAVKADDLIHLPSGTEVKLASFAMHPKWKEWFPADQAFFAEKEGDESLKGMHKRQSGRLDGASAVLHENGSLKMLAFYPEGQRQGPCRVWDEDRHMILYSQYKDGQKRGVTCLFRQGAPWLIQEWDGVDLQKESVIAKKGSDYVAVDDAQQLAQAREELSTVEKEVIEIDKDVKASLRKWYADVRVSDKDEKDKILTKVARAKATASEQRIREEEDRRQAAEHYHPGPGYRDRIGRVARADEKSAEQDRKAATKRAKVVTGRANRELKQMDRETSTQERELYDFAMAALEKALPDDNTSSTKARAPRKRR